MNVLTNVCVLHPLCTDLYQSLWSSVRASIIGRRKPHEAPVPVEKVKPLPVEQDQVAPQKEAVYASSALDDSGESDALPEPRAGPSMKSERSTKDAGKEGRIGVGSDSG